MGGWGGELKLEPSPCSIKTPQRDLCRQRRPVERIPLKPINRQRTRGFHRGGGALPPPPNNSAEDTQAEEPASGSGSKRKRLSKTNKKQTYAQRQTSIDAGSVISGIIEEKEEIQSCVSGNSPVVNTVRHSH